MNIAIAGLGKMGAALASGLHASGKYKAILGFDRDEGRQTELREEAKRKGAPLYGLRLAAGLGELEAQADLLILCVKPQDMEQAISQLGGDKSYISIAAGLSLAKLASFFKKKRPGSIARVMPNIAALVGASTSAIYCEDAELFEKTQSIFSLLGTTIRLAKEEDMHAFTALAGSGPALLCAFLEACAQGGERNGLAYERALAIAQSTMEGSLQLLRKKNLSPSKLRRQVSSPAGTTLAALSYLEKSSFYTSVTGALSAAQKRSRELNAAR